MQISALTLCGFRCFGPDPVKIDLSELTAFIGANAAGKTTVLCALQRLFGGTQAERLLDMDDFHVPRSEANGKEPAATTRTLWIEATVVFPELEADSDDDDVTVADCFRQMVVSGPDEPPYCRIRLQAEWTHSSLPEGDIEQRLYWVRPKDGDEEDLVEMRATDRSRIRVHYVPATRDPLRQIRHASGSILPRLLRAVNWSDDVRTDVAEASTDIQKSFIGEAGIKRVQSTLQDRWKEIHEALTYSGVTIRPVSKRLEDLLRQVEAVFEPSPGGAEHPIERLSDGQRSLFYLAMVGAAFDIEGEALDQDDDDTAPFDVDRLDPPSLTVFAIEEPENHISPHYLGRMMDMLRTLAESERGQVALTSHSPSIMHRVAPEEVRYLRLAGEGQTSSVKRITLPEPSDDAYKFVREAVTAYPELYFARVVVLGEGDSEEIVLARLADAFKMPIDRSFVSVVPLGGRHVNHLWRLLTSLDIPFVTVLDLDRERHGGGWGRIKYVLKQLLENGADRDKLLEVEEGVLSNDELDELHKRDVTETEDMDAWIADLENYDVFFSGPLDLDFLMLEHFGEAYEATVGEDDGPSIPQDGDDDADEQRDAVIRSVLKPAGGDGGTYSKEQIERFFWYSYLFLGRAKPGSHLAALSQLKRKGLRDDCPPVLKRLVTRVEQLLSSESGETSDG